MAGRYEALTIGEIQWETEIEMTKVLDLYRVKLTLEYEGNDELGIDSGTRVSTMLLLRPGWANGSDFSTERTRLLEDKRDKIREYERGEAEEDEEKWILDDRAFVSYGHRGHAFGCRGLLARNRFTGMGQSGLQLAMHLMPMSTEWLTSLHATIGGSQFTHCEGRENDAIVDLQRPCRFFGFR